MRPIEARLGRRGRPVRSLDRGEVRIAPKPPGSGKGSLSGLRSPGAGLTAWELGEHGVPHTVVVDNAGGHLMRRGRVDLCLVDTDRTTARGDVANKIGTYLKALAARDNDVPFYVAVPGGSVDWSLEDGDEVPIEERSGARSRSPWSLPVRRKGR